MPSIEIVVNHSEGLHARPAALFVKKASSFPCSVQVRNLSTNSPLVNAKSTLRVLTLGVNKGSTIRIEANGERAEEALDGLQRLILSDFGDGI